MRIIIGYISILSTILLIVVGCRTTQTRSSTKEVNAFPGYEMLSLSDRKKADSILTVALDQEALYTLATRLKPMSSVGYSFSYSFGKDSTQHDGDASIVNTQVDSIQHMLKDIASWHRIANALSYGDFRFIVVPYKNVYKGKRHVQLLICRQSLIDSLVQQHQTFFGQWGFTPGIDPHTLITAIEFEQRYDRFRAYGYLFGYPAYAVDFFIEADKENERTKQFVKRDFFHIPTYARQDGHFTYAIPKGHKPTAIDSAIYRKGVKTLETYKLKRKDFVTEGHFNAIAYLRAILADQSVH
jgi:hypothetical protein